MPAIVGIYNWAVNQTFATIDSEPLSEEEAAAWWDEHGGTVTLVAVEDDVIAGWARLLPWRQRGYHVVEDLVYVDPVYHKRGLGRQLLGIFVEGLVDRGGLTVRIFAEQSMDCLYLDLSGDRVAKRSGEAAPGVWVHVDEAGQLAAIELLGLASAGGLRADPMDGEQPRPRPRWYDDIEAAANWPERSAAPPAPAIAPPD